MPMRPSSATHAATAWGTGDRETGICDQHPMSLHSHRPIVASDKALSAPISILLVDDEQDNLWTMKEVLDRPGLDVLTATSAPGALALLDEHEMALAGLDIPVPAIDGFELAERM